MSAEAPVITLLGRCVWCGNSELVEALTPIPGTDILLCPGCMKRYEGGEGT